MLEAQLQPVTEGVHCDGAEGDLVEILAVLVLQGLIGDEYPLSNVAVLLDLGREFLLVDPLLDVLADEGRGS
ncbi:MAG: hypothetical protein MZW92_06510 [Comamonadaceae bacterium]|nr:hypothetical protein [Comamonadaceae bacterium]